MKKTDLTVLCDLEYFTVTKSSNGTYEIAARFKDEEEPDICCSASLNDCLDTFFKHFKKDVKEKCKNKD